MSTSTMKPNLSYRIADGVTIADDTANDLIVQSQFGAMRLPELSEGVRESIKQLAIKQCDEDYLCDRVLKSDGCEKLPQLYYYLQQLTKSYFLYREVSLAGEPLATLIPISLSFHFSEVNITHDGIYQLSRFAYIRRHDENRLLLESPLAHAQVLIHNACGAAFIHHLTSPTSFSSLASAPNAAEKEITSFLSLLIAGGFVGETSSSGQLNEDCNQTLMQWDFHDLLFHSRSRMGRHNNPIGGNFRFMGRIAPQPAIKPKPTTAAILLYKPDIEQLIASDRPLTEVIETRQSVRSYGKLPITVKELGEFLYRVARVKEIYTTNIGEFTKRPYPSGGASYEIEMYLTVDQCDGLEQGFYYYSPVEHALCPISGANEHTEGMLQDAWRATAGICRPQILITLAARFQRVSWKYQGMAYATILKNVGVLYQTMYLVGTAMNLATSALGLGNVERFCQVASTDYFVESSVGEFMLGSQEQ